EPDGGHQQDHNEGDHDLKGAKLPDRASLLDAIDGIAGSRERADVSGGAPQRRHESDAQRNAGIALVADYAIDGPAERLDGRRGADVIDDAEDRVSGLGMLSQQA